MSLNAEGLTFTYPGSPAPVFRDLSFTASTGESVALVGPSGVGKSTLLGVLGGQLRPDEGQVTGDAIAGVTSWVLQSANLLPRRSARDNVALPAILRGTRRSDAEAAAQRWLDRVGIGELADRAARTLSGGQAQRVGVARACILDPSLLIADEPTANLDPETAVQVATTLVEAAAARATLLIATHDPRVAALCDRTILWSDLLHHEEGPCDQALP